MYTYYFISQHLTFVQAQEIVSVAGYNSADYEYIEQPDHEGFTVMGKYPMPITLLEEAARKLKISVSIYAVEPNAPNVDATAPVALSASAGMAYSILIQMSSQTVIALMQSGYQLCGFKAVQSASGGGAPLVWFSSNNLMQNVQISWTQSYQAYISNSQIVPNGQVVAMSSYPISLGQTFQVQNYGGGQVVNSGSAGSISILNQSTMQFTCGISESVNGQSFPICAFPLYGNFLDVIAPVEKVLLMFTSMPMNVGTVAFQSYGPGVLIDLTSSNFRTVEFDINTGWSWGGASWGQSVPANMDIRPMLIQSSYRSADIEVAEKEEEAR